jgi:hypothetical protein
MRGVMGRWLVGGVVLLGVLVFGVCGAQAETAGPRWRVLSVANPTNFSPGDQSGADAIVITAVNVGGVATGCTTEQIEAEPRPGFSPVRACPGGSPVVPAVTVSDQLPAGLKAVEVLGDNAYHDPLGFPTQGKEAGGPPYGLSCSLVPVPSCSTSEPVDPGDVLVVTIRVHVETSVEGSGEVTGEVNEASVSGGGAASVSVNDPVTISSTPAGYGIATGGLMAASSSTQAGGHPNVTGEFFLDTINSRGEKGEGCDLGVASACTLDSEPPGQPKDVRFDLPAGLVGTTVGVPRCTMAEVVNQANCPRDTMIGTATLLAFAVGVRYVITVPVYNIAPSPGEPAAFAFDGLFFPVRLDTSVLSDGEYNVRVTAPDITGGAAAYMSSVTIWGDPAEHNGPGPDAGAKNLSAWTFLEKGRPPQVSFGGRGVEEFSEGSYGRRETVFEKRVALLTAPTQCSTPLVALVESDSWEAPEPLGSAPFTGAGNVAETSEGTATGCGQLSFGAEMSMLPDTLQAGAPAGYSLDLSVPQNVEAEGLATPNVRRVVTTLPLGTVISPSAANGLGDCTSEQFGLRSGVPGGCPRDSQVGSVLVETPALEKPLLGDVFLASPECDPCSPQDAASGGMVRLFVQVVGKGEDGIVVKLEGRAQIDQQTGQVTATFNENPQLPFSEFQLTLTGGERATLSNPRSCGLATTTMDLTPWSAPFTPDATPESTFDVHENCFGPQFTPSFIADTTSNGAGGFSPFVLSFGRGDSDQYLNGVQLHMPPWLLGMISSVTLCQEPEAALGTCGAASEIGEVSVETGPGADPFLVTGGKVFITGPYKGAPYGLSIVVPAKAGPYTLSGTTGTGAVVVRSAISINPVTTALTVTSDPLPTELDGIPLQLRRVNVTVGGNDKFTFNPANCNKAAVEGTLTSVANATAQESSPFQVTNCAALKFQPKFSVSTGGRASKAKGASLAFKISYPKGVMGSEAWFKEAKFDIPKQLPARLTTLQQACLAATFEKNPAACPAHSLIGYTRVHTEVLPVPLEGPVYFVSYGGAKFPDAVVVLQGQGVTVDLTGETFINKKTGVTSATFPDTPEVPFESIEVSLPTGPFSEFGANLPGGSYNFCGRKLSMPVFFESSTGVQIHENTPVAVAGCSKAKAAKTAKAARRARAKKAGVRKKKNGGVNASYTGGYSRAAQPHTGHGSGGRS